MGDVWIALRAESDGLRSDLDDARQKTTSWADNLGGKVSSLLGGAVVGAATAAGAAVVGIGAAAFSTASQLDEAADRAQASLGATDEKAAALKETIASVYKNNFGDDIGDVGDSVVAIEQAFQRVGGVARNELGAATENAIALRDAFDVDVVESAGAAAELMDKFGLSSEQAFNFIAAGYQKGLDSQGDFIDSITEYSTQFAEADATAGQFFSLLESGLQGGVLGTDKAADAFKEFRLRIGDGSKATADGLKLLGINADAFTQQLSTGAITGADAFEIVLGKLREIEDPTLRIQAGVALLGTQYEDLGDSAVAGLSLADRSINDFAGSVDKLASQYDNLPSLFEGLKRRALIAISPIGDALLNVANAAMPAIEAAFTSLETAIVNFIANSNFEWSPEFKQVKLGDLFEFVQAEGKTTVDIADYVSVEWGGGDFSLSIGDLFSFSREDGATSIDLADYVSVKFDTSKAKVDIKVGDLFRFVRDGGRTEVNITELVSVKFDSQKAKVDIKVGDLFEFKRDETQTDINVADYFTVSWTPDSLLSLKFGDLVQFAEGETTVNLGDYFSLGWGPDGVTKFKLGDFIDLTDTGTLSATVGGALSEAAASLTEALGAPDWVAKLGAYTWPELKEGTKTTLDSLVAWVWPDEPTTIGELLTWAWPDAPGDISTLITWAWPEFSVGIMNAITTITGFTWPKLEKPDWIDSLLNFSIPTPGWVTALLNWSPSLPSLPGFLGGNDDPTPGTNSGGSIGPSGSVKGAVATVAPTKGGVTVNFYDTVINNDTDVEEIAQRVGQRIGYYYAT